MVRFASGAFVTSPTNSVMAEAGTLPFELLAIQSTIRVALRILTKDSSNINLPLIRRSSVLIEDISHTALPRISQLIRRSDREWYARKPSIVWDVKKNVRAGDPPDKVRPIVQQLLSTFKQSTVVYTDGSKLNDTVGAGLYGNGLAIMWSLPKECSVFSAEAYAIKMALSIPYGNNELVILSDSASCLQALERGKSKHPWIQEIESIARNKSVRFCWIPGHAGVRGNTEADRLANEARAQPAIDIPIPPEDALKMLKKSIRHEWDRRWFDTRDAKLREIKVDTHRWIERSKAADQRILTRLRIGHTRLTHTFLLKKEPPPIYECCGTTLDVRHLILQCRKYDAERQVNNISISLREALSNDEESERRLLNYLQQADLSKFL